MVGRQGSKKSARVRGLADGRQCMPVLEAVKNGSLDTLTQLLKQGYSPDLCSRGDLPPVYLAMREGRADIAMQLIRAGCEVSRQRRPRMYNTFKHAVTDTVNMHKGLDIPLIIQAAEHDMTDVVVALCDRPDNEVLSARDAECNTVLHLAIRRKNSHIISKLLGKYHPLCTSILRLHDGAGLTPLHLAASIGDPHIMSLLLSPGLCEDSQSSAVTTAIPLVGKTGIESKLCADTSQCETSTQSSAPLLELPCESSAQSLELPCVASAPSLELPCVASAPSLELPCETGTLLLTQLCETNTLSLEKLYITMSTPLREQSSGTNTLSPEQSHKSSPLLQERSCETNTRSLELACETNLPSQEQLFEIITPSLKQACKSSANKTDSRISTRAVHQLATIAPLCKTIVSKTSHLHRQIKASHKHEKTLTWQELVNLPTMGNRFTPLHIAARGCHLEIIKLLIHHGAKVNSTNIDNNTPLHCLCMESDDDLRQVEAARELLEAGAHCDLQGTMPSSTHLQPFKQMTIAMIAAARNQVSMLQLLADYGANFTLRNADGMTALMLALAAGSEATALHLLNFHPEPLSCHTLIDTDGRTHMHYVSHCMENAGRVAGLLLNQGYSYKLLCDSHRSDSDLSQGACCSWKHGCCLEVTSRSPLCWAVCHGRLEVVATLCQHDPTLLLDDGTKTNSTDSAFFTAMRHQSADFKPYLTLLLTHGADANILVDGRTALDWALEASCMDLSLFLRKVGGQRVRYKVNCVTPVDKTVECFPPYAARLWPTHGHTWGNNGRRRPEDNCLQASYGQYGPEHLLLFGFPLSLKDFSMNVVRVCVRKHHHNFMVDITSLPVPTRIAEELMYIGL